MENTENTKNKDLQEVGGKKKHKKSKKHIIVGKVYADWCGHCKALKPEWKQMKSRINQTKGRKNIVYSEIEANQINTKLKKLQKENNIQLKVEGYPTLFRIENGKVDYYNGNREAKQMAEWYLNGGNNLETENQFTHQMPGLMQDLQGGRRYFTRNRNRHNSRRSRHHNYTNTRRRRTLKKTPGVFDFLFGK